VIEQQLHCVLHVTLLPPQRLCSQRSGEAHRHQLLHRRGGGRVDLGCHSLRVLERVDQLQRDV